MFGGKAMTKICCEAVQQQMDLYVAQELEGDELQQFASHISGCDICAKQLQASQDLFRQLQKFEVNPPTETQWREMAIDVHRAWRQGSAKTAQKYTASTLCRKFLQWLAPENRRAGMVFATVGVLTVGLYLMFTAETPFYSPGLQFHERYFAEFLDKPEIDHARIQPVNLYGFSGVIEPGGFAIGAYYANTLQSCLYGEFNDCSRQLHGFRSLLGDYDNRINLPAFDATDKRAAVRTLNALDLRIGSQLEDEAIEHYLYRFGIWVNNISFAALNENVSVVKEKKQLSYITSRARQ